VETIFLIGIEFPNVF